MNTELAHRSHAKREALQPGEGEQGMKVELDLYGEDQMIGNALPQSDLVAIRDLLSRARQRELQRI